MINLLTLLPFYDYQLEQNQYRENCNGYGVQIYISDKFDLIPWQIAVPNTVTNIQTITLYSLGAVFNIDLAVNNANFKLVTQGTNKWIIFLGGSIYYTDNLGAVQTLDVPGGIYEWQVEAAGKPYFSEQFYIVGVNDPCPKNWNIKIRAWNDDNWNGFYFNNEFKFVAYFDTFISNIIASIADSTNKDGYDRQVLNNRVISPTFRIKFDPMPNVFSVALSIVTGMKHIEISDLIGNVYVVKDIKLTQTPVEDDCLDLVVMDFTIFDNDYIKTNCNK